MRNSYYKDSYGNLMVSIIKAMKDKPPETFLDIKRPDKYAVNTFKQIVYHGLAWIREHPDSYPEGYSEVARRLLVQTKSFGVRIVFAGEKIALETLEFEVKKKATENELKAVFAWFDSRSPEPYPLGELTPEQITEVMDYSNGLVYIDGNTLKIFPQ